MRIFFKSVCATAVCVLCMHSALYCQQPKPSQEKFVGEFAGYNVKVPVGNYYFVLGTLRVFGTKWGAPPQTEAELEAQVWDQLLLSYEAFRRNITVDQKEIDDEIGKILKSEKVDFDWKADKALFEKWLKEKTNEPPDLFQNQLGHLKKIEKLRQQVLDSVIPTVTEDEARQEFLNEYNTLEIELVQFDEKKDAEAFFNKMKKPSAWVKEGKRNPKFAQHPGFVSLEFLINMWKIPFEDCYKMIKLEVNTIYPPTPIYKGFGVFRILKKRVADESEYPKLRDSYFKQVESIKRYQGLEKWLKKLREEAKIVIYPKEAMPAAAKDKVQTGGKDNKK